MTDVGNAVLDLRERRMLEDVRAGLSQPQKELPSKYFYDRRGSELFEEITSLPEYYLTRVERALLTAWMPPLIAQLGPHTLVELGAGNADKARIILDAMRAEGVADRYVPIDVSAAFLRDTASRLEREYPGLHVAPCVADISGRLDLPADMAAPVLYAFLGSTLGNFDTPDAIALLGRIRSAMRPGDHFLLGADRIKDIAVIEAAYNDAAGITAEFNRNMLRVLNRELHADFRPESFAHRAFYNVAEAHIEMHLVSLGAQRVHIPGIGAISFREGESIRTEISCKYDRARLSALFAAAGLSVTAWCEDAGGRFALVLASRAP